VPTARRAIALGVIVACDAELDMEEEESAELERGGGVEDVNDKDDSLALGREREVAT